MFMRVRPSHEKNSSQKNKKLRPCKAGRSSGIQRAYSGGSRCSVSAFATDAFDFLTREIS